MSDERITALEEKLKALGEFVLKQHERIAEQSRELIELIDDHVAQAAAIDALTKVCAIMLPLIDSHPQMVQLALTQAVSVARDASEQAGNNDEYQQDVSALIEQWRDTIAQGGKFRASFATLPPRPWLIRPKQSDQADAGDAPEHNPEDGHADGGHPL